MDPALFASSPRDHRGRGRSAATPASHANESAGRFHQGIARRSSLARRTPGRSHPDHRVARRPRRQERALDPEHFHQRRDRPDVALGDELASSALNLAKANPRLRPSPSRGPGNGILRAETGGLFQAQNAGEQSEFGSQTTLRLTNPPELRGFLCTGKPRRFAGTGWYCLTRSRSFRSARHRQPWRLRV